MPADPGTMGARTKELRDKPYQGETASGRRKPRFFSLGHKCVPQSWGNAPRRQPMRRSIDGWPPKPLGEVAPTSFGCRTKANSQESGILRRVLRGWRQTPPQKVTTMRHIHGATAWQPQQGKSPSAGPHGPTEPGWSPHICTPLAASTSKPSDAFACKRGPMLLTWPFGAPRSERST